MVCLSIRDYEVFYTDLGTTFEISLVFTNVTENRFFTYGACQIHFLSL